MLDAAGFLPEGEEAKGLLPPTAEAGDGTTETDRVLLNREVPNGGGWHVPNVVGADEEVRHFGLGRRSPLMGLCCSCADSSHPACKY